jgi:hypothetical protein
VKFEVLTAASMKLVLFWAVAFVLVEVYRRFRGACFLHLQGDETSVNLYRTTWYNNPESSRLLNSV